MPVEKTTTSTSSWLPSAKARRFSPARRHASGSAGALAGVYLRPWIQSCGAAAGRPDRRAARPSAQEQTHHVGFETQRLEGTGGFEAKQTAPDHHPALAAPGGAANGFQILDGAIDEALVVLAALDGRHPGEPVASTSLSYPTTVPLLECTSRLALSIFFTASPSSNRMPCLS